MEQLKPKIGMKKYIKERQHNLKSLYALEEQKKGIMNLIKSFKKENNALDCALIKSKINFK